MKRTIYQTLKVAIALVLLAVWITALRSLAEGGSSGGKSMTIQWNDGHQNFKFVVRGEVHFTDDEQDIKSVSPDGSLLIDRKNEDGHYRFEAHSTKDGSVERIYSVDGKTRPWIPGGKEWLARQLPQLVRDSAIDAPERIARIRRTKGEAGVLDYISLTHSDGAKRTYFHELFSGDPLNEETKSRAIHQVATGIHSDGDKAELLKTLAKQYVHSDELRPGFFAAERTIHSDGDRRSVLVSVLKESDGETATVKLAAESAATISSDGDKSDVLIHAIERSAQDESLQIAFLDAANTIHSDGDHQRVLLALLNSGIASDDVFQKAFASAIRISSDGDKAHFLSAAAGKAPTDGDIFESFLDATRTIHSDGDKTHVLIAWLERDQQPEDAFTKIRAFAQAEIRSDGDRHHVEQRVKEQQNAAR